MDVMCGKCGFLLKPEDEITVYGVRQHRDCLGVMAGLVEAAKARIAELEAELAALKAAGEWRPVDDKPAHGQDVEVCAILTGVWWDDDGIFDVYQVPDEITIKGWRPAPPQE